MAFKRPTLPRLIKPVALAAGLLLPAGTTGTEAAGRHHPAPTPRHKTYRPLSATAEALNNVTARLATLATVDSYLQARLDAQDRVLAALPAADAINDALQKNTQIITSNQFNLNASLEQKLNESLEQQTFREDRAIENIRASTAMQANMIQVLREVQTTQFQTEALLLGRLDRQDQALAGIGHRMPTQQIIQNAIAQDRKDQPKWGVDTWFEASNLNTFNFFGTIFTDAGFALALWLWYRSRGDAERFSKLAVEVSQQLALSQRTNEDLKAQSKFLGDQSELLKAQSATMQDQSAILKEQADHLSRQAEALRTQTGEMTRHSERLEGLYEKNADLTQRTRGFLRSAGQSIFIAQHDRAVAAAMTQVARTNDAIQRGVTRQTRIGYFPNSLAYLTQRLQATRRLAIVTIPFLQFGALANPRGQKEFRDTLHEVFSEAGLNADRTLIIVTQPDDARIDVARHRYDDAPDALRILYDREVSREFRKRTLDDDEFLDARRTIRRKDSMFRAFRKAIKDFNRDIRVDDQERTYELADEQAKSGMDDETFQALQATVLPSDSETKKDRQFSDYDLFGRLGQMRVALAEAMAWQEGKCQFPGGVPVITLTPDDDNQDFNNTLTACIDGEEIIVCESDLTELGSRRNLMQSDIGERYLKAYRDALVDIFNVQNFSNRTAVIKRLDDLIAEAKNRPTLQTILQRLDEFDGPSAPNL